MRRIHKLVSNGSRKLQSMMGDHKSARKSSRRLMNELFMEITPLEERVLMTAITINSQADLTQYFTSSTNSYSIDAGKDSVTISSGVTINSLNTISGKAGNITISGQSVSIGANAQILANGATDAQDGSITISANNVMEGFDINALNQIENFIRLFQNQSATIHVGAGVDIEGGNVSIKTDSGNKLKDQWVSSLITQPLSAIFLETIHRPDLLSLPLTVQVWMPKSTIDIENDASISGSGNVSITSNATADAAGKSIWNSIFFQQHGHSEFGAAIGDFYTDANATITLAQNATIQSGGNVTVKTSVDNNIQLESEAIKNLGTTQTNPKAISFAWGSTQLFTTSLIDLQANSTINANGTVEIEAEAVDTNSVSTKAAAYRDGTVTAGGAYANSTANVSVIVNGKVISTANAQESTSNLSTFFFNPAFTVNFTNNSINYGSNVPYVNHQELTFDSVDGSTIPGLKPGTVYYALVNSNNPTQLQLANSPTSITPISFGGGYPTLTSNNNNYTIPISYIDNSTGCILFGYDTSPHDLPLFTNGQNVSYNPLFGQFIGTSDTNGTYIPLATANYTVKIVSSPEPDYFPMAIQLLDTNDTPIKIKLYSVFFANGSYYPVAGFDTTTSQVDFNFIPSANLTNDQVFSAPNLINGQAITFISGLDCQVGNLVNNTTYYAVVDPSTPGVIRVATTLEQANAANPAIQEAIPRLLTQNFQNAITGNVTNSFATLSQISTITQANSSLYTLHNNATSGSFLLTITSPEGNTTTPSLNYNISASQFQATLNTIGGILANITGNGTQTSPWLIGIQYLYDIGNVEQNTGLVFGYNPDLTDGEPVTYLGVQGKPIGNLTSNSTYYVYNSNNPYFEPNYPQYILNLKQTPNASAPDVALDMIQSMTSSNNQTYNITAFSAIDNLIALQLPETDALSVSSVNSTSLTNGTANYTALSIGSVQLFSLANSGTFTLSVNSSGLTQTTGNMNYNSTASIIQSALNQLSGVNVSVYGFGNLTSPWTITNLTSNQSITANSSQLLDNGYSTNMLGQELGNNVQQIWTTANGGTFTITMDVNDQAVTTAPIAYNASALDVADAIDKLVNVKAVVSGSGISTDPWQFTAYYQSIQTGDTLTFNDCWNSYNMGMIGGQKYYAVSNTEQYDPQYMYVSLASTHDNAIATSPVLINMQDYVLLTTNHTGVMTGSLMALEPVAKNESGVTIKATLEATDSVTFSSQIGLFPMLAYYTAPFGPAHAVDAAHADDHVPVVPSDHNVSVPVHDNWGSLKHFLQPYSPSFHDTGANASNNIFKQIAGFNNDTSVLDSSGGFALLVAKNNVQVIIGSTAVIESVGSVSISSEINHVLHTQADAAVSRTAPYNSTVPNSTGSALGIGLNLAFIDNTSQAVIQSNATVMSLGDISVESNITYPYAWKQTNISAFKNNGSLTKYQKTVDSFALIENIVKDAAFRNAFGVSNWLFNQSVNSRLMSANNSNGSILNTAVSGSVSLVEIKNTNTAKICEGASIQSANAVSVSADTDISQVGITGQMVLGLDVGWLNYSRNEATNYVFKLNEGNKTIGASLNVVVMDNTTVAEIGGDNINSTLDNKAQSPTGGTLINAIGGLTVEATTKNQYVTIAQGGSKSTDGGGVASMAITDVRNQNTTAAILSGTSNRPVIIVGNNGTPGNITISATDTTILSPSSGGLTVGSGGSFGSSEAILTRNVSAYIGASNISQTPSAANWPTIYSAGNISIEATANGMIIASSLALGASSSNGTSNNPAQGQPLSGTNSTFGISVSADYSEANVTDLIQAGINGGNLTGVSNLQSIDILAKNTTRLNLTTGSASFASSNSNSSKGGGGAGAASFSNYNSTVRAGILNANITAFELTINAENNKTIGTLAAGLAGDSVAGTGVSVAGSVAINHVTNDTKSEIANTTGSDLGGIDISALETDDVWAAAGTASLGKSSSSNQSSATVGFGLGFAQNVLNSSTRAIISGSELDQTEGGITVEAVQASHSFVLSAGTAFEMGKGIGVSAYGMVAINEYEKADVQALVENSQITSNSTGDILITSQLIPTMITVAGDLAVGISTSANGPAVSVGVGVSVTEVSITGSSVATVKNSTIILNQGNLTVNAYTGQSKNSDLSNVFLTLGLPAYNYNLFSLAIAGGLSVAGAPPNGTFALGIDGVGAGIGSTTAINTLANISNGSNITLLSGFLDIEALENLNVYDDAGGASIDIVWSNTTAVGVAVGIGKGVHTTTDQVIASLTNSNVSTEGNLTVSANSASTVMVIGFGVALDVSVATSVGAVGGAFSSAIAKINPNTTISSNITGGNISVYGALGVTAMDNSNYQTGVGSGSLSISVSLSGGALALAAGSSISRIDPNSTISAYIGSIERGTITTTNVIVMGGEAQILAINNQQLTAMTIAVAASVSYGSATSISFAVAFAAAQITTYNNIKAGVLYGANLTSTPKSGPTAISVLAKDNANITSTVGSGALAIAMTLGASLGLSISEITNNDVVQSLVQGANITTQGGDVVVQTIGNNSHFSKSVATSGSDGFAGAGGNSNIYDNANFTSSVGSSSSIITGNATTRYGNLSVMANTSETVTAQMHGGSAGVGSVGLYYANATRSGSTVANFVTNGNINVGNLNVVASSNQSIKSEGWSVTVGGLAGTGETVGLGIDENIQTNVSGSNNPWNIHGNLSIGASATNNATATASGVSVVGLGVGFFTVVSKLEPIVSTSVSDANLVVTGTSSMGAIALTDNYATTQSGSGALVGYLAADAYTTNSPTIELSTSNLKLSSGTATFLARNCVTYSTNADSVYAAGLGFSSAIACNTSAPELTLNLGTGTVITANGSVIVKAENDITGLGDASNMNDNTGGIMVRMGSGSIDGGAWGNAVSCLTANSAISLGDNVSVTTNAIGGKILIGSSQDWNTNQLTYMHDSSGFGGGSVTSLLTSCLTNNISLGSNVNLTAPAGSIGIGTSINSQTTAVTYSYVFEIGGSSKSYATNIQSACESVSIGNKSLLTAGGDISVTSGYDPVSGAGNLQDTYAIITAKANGGVVFTTTACATSQSDMSVTTNNGSQIISDRDVNLGVLPGIDNAACYTSSQKNWREGNTNSGTNGATQTSNVTINGNVIAGSTHQLDINIPQSGTTASVNGQVVDLANISSSLTNVVPLNGSAFVPFQAAYQPNYNATQLLNGLDETSKLILSKSISTTPVDAITLANLTATGGQVLIHANTTLSGTGTISAFSPNITVTNNSPAYLLLDGVGIPNTLNMGKITVVGSAGLPVGMTINQQLAGPSISINQLYDSAVGTGTTSGPAIAVIDPIVNTGGSVAIYNACGALVQDAAINAASVTISTPNSAYIVNTPQSYMGTGGSISDYWDGDSSFNLVQNPSFETPDLGSGSSSYQYNPQGTNWEFVSQVYNAGSGISGNDSGFTSSNPDAPFGSQVAFVQMTGQISQTISGLIAGQQYTVSFFAAQRDGYFSSSQYQELCVTLGNTILVSNLKPSSTNYQQYSYTFTPTISGNYPLLFQGLQPTNQDETVFLDQVMISQAPSIITPGLNSYVYQYTANLAATTAANILYLEQSGATNQTDFSYWLYNTGDYDITSFVNSNVSTVDYGSNYPSGASDNWKTTEYGTGVIFFGSEIPYLWQNSLATIASGSSYLTSTLGYLDTLANAQYWSVKASGNPANSTLNVTQGTGPQGDKVNPGKGIYPVVPSTFPTNATINNPQNETLGAGITAGQLDITALYIDINAPVNLGVNNLGFQANLSSALGSYIQSQLSGNTSCIPIPANYLGGSNTSLTAYYDVLANQIVLSPVAINAGVVSAIFKGGIISTTNQGKITVTSNPGQNLIDNQTGYPLVIQGIEASTSQLAGIVQFNDTLTNLSTAYVYRGNNVVQQYQGPLGANLSQLQPNNTSATSATFTPAANLAYQWNQQAYISRNLSFTNTNNSYDLHGTTYGTPTGTVNDSWSWGPLGSNGSAPGNYTIGTNPFTVSDLIELSNGTNDTAKSVWNSQIFDIPTSGNFTVQFTYQASGNKAADGIAFVFQNEGIDALGGTGGDLGYVGITGNTAAYQINLYDAGGNHVPGSNFVTGNSTSGYYNSTGNVSFTSGDPIQVNLLFNADNHTVTATLKDLANSSLSNVTVYNNISLSSLLGSQAYVGFTGGEGGATSIQTVTNITITAPNQIMPDFIDGVVSLTSPVTNYTQQISSQITQSETATTYFDSCSTSAWNFGPSTQWTWTYPTEIMMQIKNQLPACNPIAIDFSGVQSGSLSIVSNSNMSLAGNIQFPGSVNLGTNGGSISQSIGALIASEQLQMTAVGGSVGSSSSPIQINIPSTSVLSTSGDQGVFVNSQGTLTIGTISPSVATSGFGENGTGSAPTGEISLQSGGDILALNSNSIVIGTNISLFANNGSIGTQLIPLTIHTQTNQLESGSIVNGTLNAAALNSVFVNQPIGDLRIGSIITSSFNGSVSIITGNGNISDGNIPDAFNLNTNDFSPDQINHLINSIHIKDENAANTSVAAFEGSVNASYLQYWIALDNGTASNGNLTLTANGVLYYQPQANQYYYNTANQTSNATQPQVNNYAEQLYDNSVTNFENTMAFGADWATLPQFQSYNTTYSFTASNQTISALTYQAVDLSNGFAMLSLDALGTQVLGSTTTPAIVTTNLNLTSSGSIGLLLNPEEIDLQSIQNGTLTLHQQALLALATKSGELQINGNIVTVKIDKPLFVNVGSIGQVQLNAGTSISLTQTKGTLNIANISTPGDVQIVAELSINQVPAIAQVPPVSNSNYSNLVLSSGNLVHSSGFETPVMSNSSDSGMSFPGGNYQYGPLGSAWTFLSGGGLAGNGSNFNNPDAPLGGTQAAFLQMTGTMSQTITGLVKGMNYRLSFYAAQRPSYPYQSFNVTLGDNTIASNVTPTSTNYQSFTYTFNCKSSGNQTLMFTGLNPNNVDQTVFLDDIVLFPNYDNLVNNSDFETPVMSNSSDSGTSFPGGNYQYGPSGSAWTFLSGGGLVGNGSNFNNPNAQQGGRQAAFLQMTGTMSQTITGLVQGTQYRISFYAAQRPGDLNQSFNVTLGNNTIASNVIPTSTIYQYFSYPFTCTSSGTQTLTFTGLNPSATANNPVDQTVFIDQVIMTPVIAITANNLRLTSGDAIGSSTNPIAIQITGKLDSYSTSDLYLNQVSDDLLMGTIKSIGATQINAQGSLYGTDNTMKGSIGNFGANGTGWTVNSKNQTAGISQDVLTLGNASSSGESSVWLNQPTVVVNSFIVSFIYQSQYTGNGLTFCIQNDVRGTSAIGDPGAALGYGTNGVNLQIQPSIAWQLNHGAAPNATQGIGLNRNGGYGMYEQPGTINFNSNDPIQVVLQYSTTTYAFTQTLTDTVTGETYSSTLSADINLYALLGTATAYIGFTGSGPAQNISNFYFSYGSPTISAGNLTLSSGGQIGTSTSPILMLATGSVNATAPNGICLLQTDGDLYVNSISTQANVSLSAPTGSVVNSSSGSVQSSSLRSPSFGIHAAAAHPVAGIKADHLQLDSLYGLGTSNQPLMTHVNELTAINQFGSIVINNTGPLAIGNGSPGNAIQTGRSVNITSDSSITVNSSVSAAEDIQLRSISGYLGGSRINVNPGVSIASESGGVYLFGGDGVSIASGASVRSNSVVELYSNPTTGVNSTSPSLESRGQIVADNIRFNSSDIGTRLYLALAGIRGATTTPTVEFNAGSGFDNLNIDNRLDKNGLAVNIADGVIQTPNQKLILNAIDSVILELGDGNDHVKIGDNMPLNQLQIFTNGGADTIETTLSKSTVLHQSFNGGTGLDSIKINGSGQNTWASTGLVQSWERTIQHRSTESISLSSATTVNAMPVATYPAIQQIPTGLDSNGRYIKSTYQQILNRLATPKELSRWSSMLDRNTITRLQLANKLTNSDEARLLRINAWFSNYFGRPATKQESTQSLRRIHSGQSETRVLAGILANQEFFNRTQSLIATGFSRDRFITGLYKLAIDPSGAPSPALHRFLNQSWQTKGRMAVILNVLQSAPVAKNQAEGLSILINQAPAQPQDVQVRLSQSRPSGVQALLLSRRNF